MRCACGWHWIDSWPGTAGYLTKDGAPTELIKAIRHIAAGGKYVTPTLAERMAAYLGFDPAKLPHVSLSDLSYLMY